MICPHCGRNTNAADICQHCHKPTEFTTRFNSRPGAIPGIEDNPPPPPIANTATHKAHRTPSVAVFLCSAMSLLACMLSVFCLLQIGRISRKEELPLVTVPEITAMSEMDSVVIFDGNRQGVHYELPPISRGQILPTLSSSDEYLFTGWNTDPNGYGTSFQPNDIFDLELKQDLILFAQWEPVHDQTKPTKSETEPTNTVPDNNKSDHNDSDTQMNDASTATNSPPDQERDDYYG